MSSNAQDTAERSVEPNTLYIGEGVSVKGEISVPHIVVVDGSVEGNISGRAVWVGASGIIKGTIVATEAEIHGVVSENIEVKQLLFIHATGRVEGKVSYGELQLERGATISGTFSPINASVEQKEPRIEEVLGKSERPAIVQRNEFGRLLNGSETLAKLPVSDFRDAV